MELASYVKMIAAHLKLALAFSQMQRSLVKAMFLQKLQLPLFSSIRQWILIYYSEPTRLHLVTK